MRIKNIMLKDFKRFKKLTVTDIPESVKLVVITGANGSGKSALLEGLNVYRRQLQWGTNDPSYFNKVNSLGKYDNIGEIQVELYGQEENPVNRKSAFWIRSAHRHESEFNIPGIQKQASPVDDPGSDKLISGDKMVSANFVRLASSSLEILFNENNRNLTAGQITDDLIGSLQIALKNIFGDLTLNGLIDPLSDGTFFFDKGESKHFPFKNLSAGERAAFDLLLDITVRKEFLNDTIFGIDEPELHLGSKVQASLLDELLRLLSTSESQLWIATHSPGMMKRALEMYNDEPNSVAFLDTFGYDFDLDVVMRPIVPTREFWRRSLEIALDDIAGLVAPSKVILCEGNDPAKGFDAECYRAIFKNQKPDTEFMSVGSSLEVQEDNRGVAAAIQVIAPGTKLLRLIDRDDLSDNQVHQFHQNGIRVLAVRNIEGYLFDDEIIAKLYMSHNVPEKVEAALTKKNQLITASIAEGKPNDDLKQIRNNYKVWIVTDLSLRRAGGTTVEFIKQVLVPLITPDTQVYKNLAKDIFGL